MKLDFYKPVDPILQECIQGYYFISEGNDSDLLNYWTFPNNYTILSSHQNAKTTFSKNKIIVNRTNDSKITTDLVVRYTKPFEVIYNAAISEVSIYFKPLGIQNFIHCDISFLQENHNGHFSPFTDFEENMRYIFSIPERLKQIEALENYWVSKFCKKEVSVVENILHDIEAGLKIKTIAEKHNFSRQYICRIFKNNLGKSPSEYKKIHQFRNSLTKYKKVKSLTELSYENSYYDQAHFIKHFKELTHVNPTTFFKKVDAEKENVWLFI